MKATNLKENDQAINELNGNEQLIKKKSAKYLPNSRENLSKTNAARNINQISGKRRKLQENPKEKHTARENPGNDDDVASKKRRKTEKKPLPSIRFNLSLGHFPEMDKSGKIRCKNEECDKKTFVFCPICDVHLCFCLNDERNCCSSFHKLEKTQ